MASGHLKVKRLQVTGYSMFVDDWFHKNNLSPVGKQAYSDPTKAAAAWQALSGPQKEVWKNKAIDVRVTKDFKASQHAYKKTHKKAWKPKEEKKGGACSSQERHSSEEEEEQEGPNATSGGRQWTPDGAEWPVPDIEND